MQFTSQASRRSDRHRSRSPAWRTATRSSASTFARRRTSCTRSARRAGSTRSTRSRARARAIAGGPFTPALNGGAFGFDFNPTVDRIRIVSRRRPEPAAQPERPVRHERRGAPIRGRRRGCRAEPRRHRFRLHKQRARGNRDAAVRDRQRARHAGPSEPAERRHAEHRRARSAWTRAIRTGSTSGTDNVAYAAVSGGKGGTRSCTASDTTTGAATPAAGGAQRDRHGQRHAASPSRPRVRSTDDNAPGLRVLLSADGTQRRSRGAALGHRRGGLVLGDVHARRRG